MLIIFQAPFADARDFIATTTYQLNKPDWLNLNPYIGDDFIHRFGNIEKCKHKKKDWISSEVYCRAKRAFTFNESEIESLAKSQYGMVIHSRRLFPTEIREVEKDNNGTSIYYQNRVIGSLEIGFIHGSRKKFTQNPLSSNNLTGIIKNCIELNISVHLPDKVSKQCKLYDINKYLSSIYLYATTMKAKADSVSDWWITSGAPLIIVEYSTSEVNGIPTDAELISDLEEYNIRIYFGDLTVSKNKTLKTWYIETNKRTQQHDVKMLLEGLLHINASQQCLNRIINIYDKIQMTKGTIAYDNFQRYLEFSFTSLFRRKRFGFPCKKFTEVLQECEDTVSRTMRDGILTKLRALGIRGSYLRNLEEYIANMRGGDEMQASENKVDILIITAVKDESDVVLSLENDWQIKQDTRGYDYYVRELVNNEGKTLTLGIARAIDMGEVNAANLATRLSNELKPTCLAMIGICAGWRNKVRLGDVIVADRVFSYDTGKLVSFEKNEIKEDELFNDTYTYNLYPVWKQKAENMSSQWKETIKTNRPIEYEYQEMWLLRSIDDFSTGSGNDPVSLDTRKECCPDWKTVLERTESKGLVELGQYLKLTDSGKNLVNRDRYLNPDGLSCQVQPQVHVAPIATGKKVVQDRKIFPKISRNVRSVLGLEMEASAIGAVAELEHINKFIVVKSVSDYADEDKNDHFRNYSIETSYRFLVNFLKENYTY